MPGVKLSTRVWQDPYFFMAFGFGAGLIPKAPGTWGTLVAIPIYFLLILLPHWIYLFFVVLAFMYGIKICNYVSSILGVDDYSGIVWDEIVGYLFTMFLAPNGWYWAIIGFGLFRIFDIWKPFPIRWVDQHVHNGLGIMLDDVIAAVPAWIIIHCLWIITK